MVETADARVGAVTVTATATAAVADSAATCDFERGFHGTIGGLEIFARLRREHDELVGSYEYASVGVDIVLKGSARGASVTLDEHSSGKATGHFEGACDADGHVRGTWTKP
ncbi:MAG: hypothetical protein ACHREM_22065, partial [Polyangiales bacterium]